MFFLFKQKTAYEMRISDWSSDVCSSDLLLGSVHLLPESVQPLPAALDKAYGSADTLVFESDLGALDAPAMQRDVLAAARGKKGLRDEISPAMYARVQARARGDGLSDSVCDPYAAWFCAMTLEIFSFQRQGFDAASGLDQYFYAMAVNDNKSVAWLEAPTEHMRLFRSEEHTSELQSLMRISYAVFCLKTKKLTPLRKTI